MILVFLLKVSYESPYDYLVCYSNQTYNTSYISASIVCLYHCKFESIISKEQKGGGIYIHSDMRYSYSNTFYGCIFRNCYSFEGGAMYITTNEESSVKLNRCLFINNSAFLQGGSTFFSYMNYSIENCEFKNNSIIENILNPRGGSVFLTLSVGTIKNCTFINNSVSTYSKRLSSYGGSIYFYKTVGLINNCIFENNIAFQLPKGDDKPYSYSNGGAICITNSSCNFTNCHFSGNKGLCNSSYSNGGIHGGAIFSNISTLLFFSNCTFTNNMGINYDYKKNYCPDNNGGCIFFYKTNGIFSECTFDNNSIFAIYSSDECNICCNGGAINLKSSSIQINTTVFSYNSAYSIITSNYTRKNSLGASGGAICGGELICTNCSFINNSVFTIKRKDNIYGGALSCEIVKCSDCIFINNSAIGENDKPWSYNLLQSSGGAIKISTSGTFQKCKFINNYATLGAVIDFFIFNQNLNITNCIIEGNYTLNPYCHSLFNFYVFDTPFFANEFSNNKMIFDSIDQTYIFDGDLTHKKKLRYFFNWNCISLFDEKYFISRYFFINDAQLMKNLTFKDAFQYNCNDPIEISPSLTETDFSSIKTDEESLKFTPFNKFTQSDTFTKLPLYSSTSSEVLNNPSFTQGQIEESSNIPEKSKDNVVNITNVLLLASLTINLILLIIIIVIIILFVAKKRNKNYPNNNASESLYDSFIN